MPIIATRRSPKLGPLGIVLLSLLGARADAQTSRPEPLPVAEAAAAREFAPDVPIDLSPDGAWLAYSLTNPRARRLTTDRISPLFTNSGVWVDLATSGVFVTNVRTKQTVNVTHDRGSAWGGRWSPDGQRLAFYWDSGGAVHLWVWELATGTARRISDVIARPPYPLDSPRWTPDGTRLLAKVLQTGVSLEEVLRRAGPRAALPASVTDDSTPSVAVLRAGPGDDKTTSESRRGAPAVPSIWEWLRADLALVDVSTGAVRRLARDVAMSGYWISPTAESVAYMQWRPGSTLFRQLFDLTVIPLASGTPRVVASSVEQPLGASVSWSPDGRWLAYSAVDRSTQVPGESPRMDCYLVSADGGVPRNLTPGVHPPLGGENAPPLWDESGGRIFLVGGGRVWTTSPADGVARAVAAVTGRRITALVAAGDGRVWAPRGSSSLYVVTNEPRTVKLGLARVDLGGRRAPELHEESKLLTEGVAGIAASGSSLVLVAEDAAHPADAWVMDAELRRARRVTDTNPMLARYAAGESRLVEWLGANGDSLRGALLLPANYQPGRRYPLVVFVYGGELGSTSLNRYGLGHSAEWNMQILATRGYAVLKPDAPLSVGNRLRDLGGTVLPGVSRVVELGIADSNRLAIMGHSYGGYSTLGLVAQTTRFRAAVSSAGVADLFASYGRLAPNGASLTSWAEVGQGGMGGTPWSQQDRYLRNSPYLLLDRVRTPVLIVHGTEDLTAPATEGDKVYVALKALGVEVEYARYVGEEHVLFAYANVVDYWTRVIGWFDGHLGTSSTGARSDAR